MKFIKGKGAWRGWLLLLLLFVLTLVVVTRFSSMQRLGQTLATGQWQWVLVAVVLHILYFLTYAVLYQLGFDTVGVKSSLDWLIPAVFVSVFINAIAPLGGAGGAALFVDNAARRGQSGARTAVGTILVLFADIATLVPFVAFGLYYTVSHRTLTYYDLIGVSFYLFFVLGLGAVLALAYVRSQLLHRILCWIQGAVNHVGGWFRHPDLILNDWVEKNAGEFAAGARAITEHPVAMAKTLAWGTFTHLFNLVGLYFLFLAFRQSIAPGALVAGFSIGIVFWIVTIIPQGAGLVEGVMGLVFISLGADRNKTAAIVLAFRGMNFWLPLIIGFFFLRRATGVGGDKARSVPDDRKGREKPAEGQDQGEEGPDKKQDLGDRSN